MPVSKSYGDLQGEILPAKRPLMVPQALTVNLEGVMTWPIWIATVAVGQTVAAAMALGEIKEPTIQPREGPDPFDSVTRSGQAGHRLH